MEMRSVVLLTFFGVGSGRAADAVQHLLGERHGSRYDIRHAHRCFIGRHRVDGLSRAVTEVLAHAAMEMNIRQARNRHAAAGVDLRLIADFLRTVHETGSFYIYILFQKDSIFRIYTGIFNDHMMIFLSLLYL